jgi:DNA-binding transcriptional regulator YiaG
MNSDLKARFAQLGHIEGLDPVSSGSPVDLVLRPADGLAKVLTISAIRALARRGVVLLKAKRTIESMVELGEAVVHVPTVEDEQVFASELEAAGVMARLLGTSPVDARTVRLATGLTQEQFALRFGLDVDAVQNWEQGRTKPDRPAVALLRAIAAAPREVGAAQEQAIT